jgi:hypothetical protein
MQRLRCVYVAVSQQRLEAHTYDAWAHSNLKRTRGGLCTHVLLESGSPCALSSVCGVLRTCALHISCCSTGVNVVTPVRGTCVSSMIVNVRIRGVFGTREGTTK